MSVLTGGGIVLLIGYPWLQGSWMMATLMTLAWLFVTAPIVHGISPILLVVAAGIWTPFACWKIFKRQSYPVTSRALVGVEFRR